MADDAQIELGIIPGEVRETFPGTASNFSTECDDQWHPLQQDPQRPDDFLDLRTLLAADIDTNAAQTGHEATEYAAHADDLWLKQPDFTFPHEFEALNSDLVQCLSTAPTDELVDQPTPDLSWSPSTSLWPPSESPPESSPTHQPEAISKRKERGSPNKKQRKSKRTSRKQSPVPSSSGASPVEDEAIHQRHRKIEKKYRCNLATHLSVLRAAVPTLLDRDESVPHEDELLGLKAVRKKSKATTLAKAVEYIEALRAQYEEQKLRAEEAVREAEVLKLKTKECLTLLSG